MEARLTVHKMEQSKLPDLDTAGEETRPSAAEEQEGIGKLTPNDPMRWRRRLPPLRPDPGKERHIGGADDSPWWQTGLPVEGLREKPPNGKCPRPGTTRLRLAPSGTLGPLRHSASR